MKVPDEKIVAALLSSRTNAEAAKAVGLTETAFYNRLRNPELRAKLSEAKTRLLEGATVAAQGRMSEAVGVMADVMRNDAHGPQTRLNAAEAILRNAVKLTEIVDVERQITELENLIREIEQR